MIVKGYRVSLEGDGNVLKIYYGGFHICVNMLKTIKLYFVNVNCMVCKLKQVIE